MKVCSTCGRQLDTVESRCPHDGGALTVVTEARVSSAHHSSGARAAAAVAVQPTAKMDAEPDPFAEIPAGTKVGEYEIERKIGVGGMGVVYGARHPLIGKRAAIKVLNARLSVDREAVQRFVLEAQAVNQIGHANIVDIFAFGTLPDGRSYFAMEWLQGETLGERLERGPIPVRDAIGILSTLCRALEAAHAANVIHRDLKPDNVFLATDDEGWRVKLLDFGIAKLQTASPTVSKTATGIVVGTPLFMAPEQAKGEPVDGRTDVYALGLLAYTIVCGQSLFENETSAIEVLAAHITKAPRSPRLLVPDLPEAFEKLILEMVAKHPSFRPTLVEIRQQLAAIGASLGNAPLLTPMPGRLTVVAPLSPQTAPALPRPSNHTGMTPIGAGADDDDDVLPPRRARWPLVIGAIAAVAVGATVFIAIRHTGATAVKSEPDVAAEAVVRAPATAVIDGGAATVVPVVMTPTTPDAAIARAVVAPHGTAKLTIAPLDAQLTIDGAAATVTAGVATVSLPPGEHVAIVTAHGRTAQHELTIVADHDTAARIVVPAASTPTAGGQKRPPPGPTTAPPGDDVDGVQNPFGTKK